MNNLLRAEVAAAGPALVLRRGGRSRDSLLRLLRALRGAGFHSFTGMTTEAENW
jgi:hypothetical protein